MNNILQMINGKKAINYGTRRIVYDLENGTVLKIAKSKIGVESNMTEVKIYKSSHFPIKNHLGQFLKYEDDYSWLIMKRYTQPFP